MAGENIRYNIERNVGTISVNENTGWKKELKIVSWNDNTMKYDIRSWNADGSRCSKGITLTLEEAVMLSDILVKELMDTYGSYNENVDADRVVKEEEF